MEKESDSAKWIRYMAAVLGVVAFFLPLENVEVLTANFGLSLVNMLGLATPSVFMLGAVLFIAGTVVLFLHSGGLVGQATGIGLLAYSLDGPVDAGATLGLGFYLGLISMFVAFIGLLYHWAQTGWERPMA